jgi:hypothetical protein
MESLTRNPTYNTDIRGPHLLRKAFQTLGQHRWMQHTAAMRRLSQQSQAAIFWRSSYDFELSIFD